MSNCELIYKNLGTILVIQLVFMILTEIYSLFLFPLLLDYLYNIMGLSFEVFLTITYVNSFLLLFTSLIIMILWVVNLSKLYRTSGDNSVESARKLFIGVIIAEVIKLLVSFIGPNLLSISAEILTIVFYYLPSLVINFVYILAWVKLSSHFKTTFTT